MFELPEMSFNENVNPKISFSGFQNQGNLNRDGKEYVFADNGNIRNYDNFALGDYKLTGKWLHNLLNTINENGCFNCILSDGLSVKSCF
ncbi:MAG: hypothetical protein ACK4YF_08275 [Exilispira sp.]